ncbi:MAG: hypothetical protein ACFFCI_03655 [Promethearchaeota archaeon]
MDTAESLKKKEELIISEDSHEKERKKRIKIDWGRQGGVIFGYVVVLLGYYGIIVNMVLFNQCNKHWMSFTDLDLSSVYRWCTDLQGRKTLVLIPGRDIFFWTYISYIETNFLPPLLLFFVCFVLTYKEDIPHYGIKASIWLVPLLIVEGFVFYLIMFGLTSEPFILRFTRIEGYLDIFILFTLAITGAISGMKFKQFIEKRKVV